MFSTIVLRADGKWAFYKKDISYRDAAEYRDQAVSQEGYVSATVLESDVVTYQGQEIQDTL